MANRDFHSNVGVVHLLDPQDLAGVTTASSILDTNGFEGAELLVSFGAATPLGVSNYVTPVLQESDTTADADFTTVAAGSVRGAFTAVNATNEDSTTQNVGYVGFKRYVRVRLVVTGTVTALNAGVVGLLTHPHHGPATAPSPVTAT